MRDDQLVAAGADDLAVGFEIGVGDGLGADGARRGRWGGGGGWGGAGGWGGGRGGGGFGAVELEVVGRRRRGRGVRVGGHGTRILSAVLSRQEQRRRWHGFGRFYLTVLSYNVRIIHSGCCTIRATLPASVESVPLMSSTLQNQRIDANTAEFLAQAGSAKFDFHKVSVQA